MSFHTVKIINITMSARPMRNPTSWTRSESGRPLTISDIKRRSDLSLPVLSKLEAGKIRDPKFSTIVQVCKGYGLPFEALAFFVEDIAAARQVGPQAGH